jgi:hypothetical protein
MGWTDLTEPTSSAALVGHGTTPLGSIASVPGPADCSHAELLRRPLDLARAPGARGLQVR